MANTPKITKYLVQLKCIIGIGPWQHRFMIRHFLELLLWEKSGMLASNTKKDTHIVIPQQFAVFAVQIDSPLQ